MSIETVLHDKYKELLLPIPEVCTGETLWDIVETLQSYPTYHRIIDFTSTKTILNVEERDYFLTAQLHSQLVTIPRELIFITDFEKKDHYSMIKHYTSHIIQFDWLKLITTKITDRQDSGFYNTLPATGKSKRLRILL